MGMVMTLQKKYCIALIVPYFFTLQAQTREPASIRREAPHIITLFMKPYEMLPEFKTDDDIQIELVKDPSWIQKKFLRGPFKHTSDPRGIYVTYAGFVDTIDINRQVRFPRLTQEDEINLIITRKLTPVIIRGNTVEYFMRDPNYDIAYYTLKRMHDAKKNLDYWNVEKNEIPANKKISPSAFIIFAEPKHIVVPLEPTVATAGPNLVLPPIYANKGLEKDYNAFSFVKINRYFDPIQQVTKIAPPQRYGQKIGNGTR
jgi:hypothetical protein